jgi:hypothetical protein
MHTNTESSENSKTATRLSLQFIFEFDGMAIGAGIALVAGIATIVGVLMQLI